MANIAKFDFGIAHIGKSTDLSAAVVDLSIYHQCTFIEPNGTAEIAEASVGDA